MGVVFWVVAILPMAQGPLVWFYLHVVDRHLVLFAVVA